MKALWLLLTLALAFLSQAVLSPQLAYAALDPKAAETDTHTLLQSGDYTFCTKPEDPLTASSRDLCPLAGEIPGCSAFVEACDKTIPPPPKLSAFWENLLGSIAKILPYLAWAVVAALVIFVLYLVFRAIRAAQEDAVEVEAPAWEDVAVITASPLPEGATAADVLLRRAREAQARGDYRTALFTYLAASLSALDRRGAIRLTRDRTNGEYVRGCQEAPTRPQLRALVREIDGVQFGGNDATADAVTLAATHATAIVEGPSNVTRGAMGAVMMLSVVAFLGACHGGLGGRHDDPGGRDLLVELLTKQGAHITSLPGSLANLPMKGVTGPAVVLDAERVPLEEETRDHLVAWVKQGGALVLVGDPSHWPSDFWAKRTLSSCTSGPTTVKVETRDTPVATAVPTDDDDDDTVTAAPVRVQHARLAHAVAMTWPSEDRTPKAIAHLDTGDLYGALRAFGDGQVLGLASADLTTNAGLSVPGNAAALFSMLAALDREDFSFARSEQGIAPPSNPFAGLMHIGLGPALIHAAVFIPLLFFAFGVRQAAPRAEPPPPRRAFAEHVQAVGALYARTRASGHALAVYAKHVDDRVRATMPRGNDPAQFLAARAGVDPVLAADLYARALRANTGEKPREDDLQVLQRLSAMYARAIARS